MPAPPPRARPLKVARLIALAHVLQTRVDAGESAADLARALGTVGHLVALRRTASGRFRIEDAVPFEAFAKVDDASREALVGRLLPLGEAVAALPRVTLTERGAKDAFHGRPILLAEGVAEGAASLVPGRAAALFAPDGSLLAIGELRDASSLRVVRGFR